MGVIKPLLLLIVCGRGMSFDEHAWDGICSTLHTISMDLTIRLIQFKNLHGYYWTPSNPKTHWDYMILWLVRYVWEQRLLFYRHCGPAPKF